jgi:hypothetical protein
LGATIRKRGRPYVKKDEIKEIAWKNGVETRLDVPRLEGRKGKDHGGWTNDYLAEPIYARKLPDIVRGFLTEQKTPC